MDTKGTTMRQVALMQFAADEAVEMGKLNAVWIQTMDLKHEDMLAYPLDIMVEDVKDICQRKYVDREDFFPYEAENGSHWLISNSMQIEDLDAFFKCYFHEDEVEAA